MPFLRRIYVLNDTVKRDKPRKMDEITMMTSGKPSGTISLADGSMPFEDVDIVDPGQT